MQEIIALPCDSLHPLDIISVSYFSCSQITTNMMYLKQSYLWLTFVAVLLVACAGSESVPSESDLQATVDAAVEATTESLNSPTFTPIPTVAAESSETEAEQDEAADTNAGVDIEEIAEPPTQTPIPTVTNTPEPTATPIPADPFIRSELDDGSVRYELPLEGFGMTLPSDWLVANLTESAENEQQTEIEEVLGSAQFRNLVASGLKFYAINLSETSKGAISPANINIASEPLGNVTSVQEIGTATVEKLVYDLNLFEDEISQSSGTIGDLQVERLDYFQEIATPRLQEKVTLQFIQYIAIANDTIYRIVISLPADLAPTLLPDAEAAIQEMNFYATGE